MRVFPFFSLITNTREAKTDAIEILETQKWIHPSYYGGFSPDGDFLVYSRHRDSDILTETNYTRILQDLEKFNEKYPAFDNPDIESGENNYVYDFRASHWRVGWIEYILIRQDAPDEIKQAAGEIIAALSDYPVYDESAYSEAQFNAIGDYWDNLPMQEKIDKCKEHDLSIFAARRLPEECFNDLSDSIN